MTDLIEIATRYLTDLENNCDHLFSYIAAFSTDRVGQTVSVSVHWRILTSILRGDRETAMIAQVDLN